MEKDIFFWWSVVSTILGVIFLCVSIWQFKESKNQKEQKNAQVKVWMQEANGLSQALTRIVSDNVNGRYSTVNDVCNTVWALQITAFSMYQSLYEERAVTEQEYKERQKRIADDVEKQQKLEERVEASPK